MLVAPPWTVNSVIYSVMQSLTESSLAASRTSEKAAYRKAREADKGGESGCCKPVRAGAKGKENCGALCSDSMASSSRSCVSGTISKASLFQTMSYASTNNSNPQSSFSMLQDVSKLPAVELVCDLHAQIANVANIQDGLRDALTAHEDHMHEQQQSISKHDARLQALEARVAALVVHRDEHNELLRRYEAMFDAVTRAKNKAQLFLELLRHTKTVLSVTDHPRKRLPACDLRPHHVPRLCRVVLACGCLTSSDAEVLASMLPQCEHLTEFGLCTSTIGRDAVAVLAPVLPCIEGLTTLTLAISSLDDAGAKLLANALPECTSLGLLYMSSSVVGEAGGFAISKAIRNHVSLHSAGLHFGQMSDVSVQALKVSLAHLKFLKI